jgi:hypothetical protein
MLNRLSRSLDVLLRQKSSLSARAQQLAQTEQRLIENLSQALSSAGYRVVPVQDGTTGARGATRGRGLPKRLRCPECDRRFSHPLPMARHMKATHGKAAHAKAQPVHGKAEPKKGPGRRRRRRAS